MEVTVWEDIVASMAAKGNILDCSLIIRCLVTKSTIDLGALYAYPLSILEWR